MSDSAKPDALRVAIVVTVSRGPSGEAFYRVEGRIGRYAVATFDRRRDAALGRIMAALRRVARELENEKPATGAGSSLTGNGQT